MSPENRDLRIIKHILNYCDQIQETMNRLGNDYSIFVSDHVYMNAVSLCILQIGELVGSLTEDFRQNHSEIPWRQIRGMRNIVAHRYGTIDTEITWEVIAVDIPQLKLMCQEILAKE